MRTFSIAVWTVLAFILWLLAFSAGLRSVAWAEWVFKVEPSLRAVPVRAQVAMLMVAFVGGAVLFTGIAAALGLRGRLPGTARRDDGRSLGFPVDVADGMTPPRAEAR